MAFSGALTLTDLNDYLGPSQACIKPIDSGASQDAARPEAEAEGSDAAGAASTQIAIDHDGSYYESASQKPRPDAAQQDGGKPRERTKLETAEISLNDCLACSGCVTSAESVLITMQSQQEMRRAIEEMQSSSERTLLVASISPQTLASLSARYSFDGSSASARPIPLRTLLHRISHFLRTRFGFDYVLDTTFARHLSLKEHEREFFERRSNTLKRKRRQDIDIFPSSSKDGNAKGELALPMLASACPGWICYAEKTHGELLPYVSRTKSPQQISGVLAKKFIASRLGVGHKAAAGESTGDATTAPRATSVYHITVMPCYDKKLEASRSDFFDEITGTKEVDCVLTTGELDKLMRDEGFDVQSPVDGEQDLELAVDLTLSEALGGLATTVGKGEGGEKVTVLPRLPTLLDQPGSSSGGYLFHLMKAIWIDWLNENRERLSEAHRASELRPELDVKILRTSDFTEYVLRAPALCSTTALADQGASVQAPTSRPILFRAAQCYGFRNLQNLVRKVQRQTGVKSGKGAAGRLVDSEGRAVTNGTGGRGRVIRGRGRGMVRRGRGAAASASSASSSVAAVESEGTAPTPTDADEEEAYGYDYVEVMACPGGCVNGGGQLRPPTAIESAEENGQPADEADLTASKTCSKREEPAYQNGRPKQLDPEGYASGWVSDQTPSADPSRDIRMLDLDGDAGALRTPTRDNADQADETEIKGWQGTSKEWVRRVEKAYWAHSRFSHAPMSVASFSASASGAATPSREGGGNRGTATPTGAAATKRDVRNEDKARILAALVTPQSSSAPFGADSDGADRPLKAQPDSLTYSDLLAELVTKELSILTAAALPSERPSQVEATLAEARKKLFRTSYRAVKDELVSGLAVQW
ncbi:Cytosolic Fe-S cluster assembly factor nar1 [Thecaphora frezii]